MHNLQGTIGLGVGKASEVQAAVAKADKQALKSLFFVPRYQGATIHQLRKVKYGALHGWSYLCCSSFLAPCADAVSRVLNCTGVCLDGVAAVVASLQGCVTMPARFTANTDITLQGSWVWGQADVRSCLARHSQQLDHGLICCAFPCTAADTASGCTLKVAILCGTE